MPHEHGVLREVERAQLGHSFHSSKQNPFALILHVPHLLPCRVELGLVVLDNNQVPGLNILERSRHAVSTKKLGSLNDQPPRGLPKPCISIKTCLLAEFLRVVVRELNETKQRQTNKIVLTRNVSCGTGQSASAVVSPQIEKSWDPPSSSVGSCDQSSGVPPLA